MALFSADKELTIKVELLESKLTMFEELSRDMMNTLNDAVSKISEANQTISKCLVSHDERLKQYEKNDRDIKEELSEIRKETDTKITELKISNEKDHKSLENHISQLSKKLDVNNVFRLKISGAIVLIIFLISLMNSIPTIGKVVDIIVHQSSYEKIE